tara:strand:+ start:128 stop:448 length:321 start_codon:yes stop_codon:yes gene_type:complete
MNELDIEADPPANDNQGSYSTEIKYFVYIVVFFTAYSIVPSIMLTLKNNKNQYQNNTYNSTNSTNSTTINENNKSKITVPDKIISFIISALISSTIGTIINEVFLK